MSRLVWYRNDLRMHYHRPLQAAQAAGEDLRALYLLCPDQWQEHGVAPLRQWFVLASLQALGESLAAAGIQLDVIDCGDFKGVPKALEAYVKRHGIRHIHCTREYPLNEMTRDRAVAERLAGAGVEIHGVDDAVLVPPRALKTGQGGWYTVFTPYRRSWEQWLREHDVASVGRIRRGEAVTFPGSRVVEQALSKLDDYQRQRDLPAESGTSGLSAALSTGTLSPAECFRAARERREQGSKGADTWIGELAWRDFYRQIMAHFPRVSRGQPFRDDTGWVQWRHDQEDFQAWCEGRTGYPLVDAAMRQLQATGWMHNRLRMVSAMFLTKNLFIDWRWGERWFMAHLVDGDFAANNGGWQWSASTGTDAAPYFRVFNPVRQSQRFDPAGRFIARYVPELAHLDDKTIHEPWRQPLLAPDYPPRIVALQGTRERVTAAFQAARDLASQEQH